MKKCFTFSSYTECKKLAKHLEAKLSTNVFIQLGNTLTVSRDMYEAAIIEGRKYVTENQITCNWVDAFGQETPIPLVPFSYIAVEKNDSVFPYCLSSSVLSAIKTFSLFCEALVQRQVFIQVRPNGNVVFLIEQPISIDEQFEIVQKIREHSCYHRIKKVTQFSFTDCFGANIAK